MKKPTRSDFSAASQL